MRIETNDNTNLNNNSILLVANLWDSKSKSILSITVTVQQERYNKQTVALADTGS